MKGIKKYSFKRISPADADWEIIEAAYDSTVFHTRKWNEYVKKMGYGILVAEVYSNEDGLIGHFIGASKWFLIRIVMAPSMGTGTYSQGLCMQRTITNEERIAIYLQLVNWLYKSKLADYVQICDWQLRTESTELITDWHDKHLDHAGVYYNRRTTFFLDIQRPEEELWAGLQYKSCKYAINKARKDGLAVKEVKSADEIDSFVDSHYKHIKAMLHRKKSRGLPCQRKKNMSALCHSLFPDKVLMLQVVGPDGNGNEVSMSSGIFANGPAGSSYFTGGSFQEFMHHNPNDLMAWEAIRILHGRGAGDLIFGGTSHYKKKFGCIYAYVPVMVFSRFRILLKVRPLLKRYYEKMMFFFGHIMKRGKK